MAELIELRDGSTTTDSRLGRLKSFDERSRGFGIAGHPQFAAETRTTIWTPPPVLDQGPDGTCVGHGFEGEAGASPVEVRPCTHDDALVWFDAAAAIDEWPSTQSRADGTSVLAGAKIGVKRGFITEYRWCFSKADVYAALQEGPVVVGTDWLDGMWNPDAGGRLSITGTPQGGHCWLIYGLVLAGSPNPLAGGATYYEDIYLMQNSWGTGWGKGGRAWLPTGDNGFEKLRLSGGEVCVPVGRKDPYAVVPTPPKPKPGHWKYVWNRLRRTWQRIWVAG